VAAAGKCDVALLERMNDSKRSRQVSMSSMSSIDDPKHTHTHKHTNMTYCNYNPSSAVTHTDRFTCSIQEEPLWKPFVR